MEYGGTDGAFDNSSWKREILNDREYFKRLEEFHSLDDLDTPSLESPGRMSLNGKIDFIDAETEDSEGSEGGQFFNCDSPETADQMPESEMYLKERRNGEECVVGDKSVVNSQNGRIRSTTNGGGVEKT